jgi:GAF domain-containing protein
MSSRPDSAPSLGRKRNVGFIELPDEALDVFSHYTQLPDWDVALVVSTVYDSYAVRMAEILQVPVLDVPNRLSLLSCGRVIVGNRPVSLLATVRELLAETAVEVIPVDEALQELGTAGPSSPGEEKPAANAPAAGSLNDGIWTEVATGTTADPAEPAAPGESAPEVEAGAETAGDGGVEAESSDWMAERWPGIAEEVETPIPRRDPVDAQSETEAEPAPAEDIAEGEPVAEAPPVADGTEAAPVQTADDEFRFAEEPEVEASETADADARMGPRSAEVAEVDLPDPEDEEPAAGESEPVTETEPFRKKESRQWSARMALPSEDARGPGETGPAEFRPAMPGGVMPEATVPEAAHPLGTAEHDAAQPSGSEEPEPAHVPAFDAGTLLGTDIGDRLGALALDTNEDRLLREILQLAVRATHAQTGSIMLLDEDGENLRIAVAQGLPPEVVADTRRKVGEGMAGEVFTSGTSRIVRGTVQGSSEGAAPGAPRESASVPILSDGRPIGVLNVNVNAEGSTLDDKALSLLTRFAKEASGAILKALDLRRLDGVQRREALLRQVDRLMALQESLPSRLHAVGDALGAALSADFVHFFVVDPLGRRLELQTPPRGTAVWHPKSQPLDKGFLGWAVRQGTPHLLGVAENGQDARAALICLPIQSSRPHALVVLENLPLAGSSSEKVMALLNRVVDRVQEVIGVEEGADAQELLYQLEMRVSDQVPQLLPLPPVQRTRAALELAVQLLAGEAAIWVPPHGARPVTSEPHTSRASGLLADARASLDLLSELVQDRGAVAGGSDAAGWDAKAPRGPAPYVGVSTGSEEGVLLLFFSPDETVGSPAQVPAQVLLRVLVKISEICSSRFSEKVAASASPPRKPMVANPRSALGPKDMEALIHQEWLRSRRYGHAFALTRFRLQPGGEGDPAVLRDFILREKRDVDFMAEVRPGVFVILSPEVDQNPDGLMRRLSDTWRRRAGSAPLEAEQRIFPRDGHAAMLYKAWVRGEGSASRAA